MTEWRIRPLTPATGIDFLRFFDHESGPAFADNADWAKCYCHFYEVARSIEWSSLTAEQNRVAMRSRIGVGEMEGFLAYDADTVVGWLNAQPRHKLPHCFERMKIPATALPCALAEAAVIVCFVVAPTHRRGGVARALLEFALTSLTQRGFKLVDAFPFKVDVSSKATDHYHGSAAMFTAAGFTVLDENDSLTVVRRYLAAD